MTTSAKSTHPDFFFLGNQLVLDFLNTRPVLKDQAVDLLTDFGDLLRWFVKAGPLNPAQASFLRKRWTGTQEAERTLRSFRNLRETLRQDLLAWEGGGRIRPLTVRMLDELLKRHPMKVRLRTKGNGFSSNLWFDAQTPQDLFAPLAHDVAQLLTSADRRRVRRCEACVLHFRDTSKKGTRRWCSMQICGNRSKVAEYARRHRR
ncbi:MAG TPA: ABATE domain-containing protein [Terriglobales bacterium]|nr:ABATE domain-containing protein [Terriglobales bacterium]